MHCLHYLHQVALCELNCVLFCAKRSVDVGCASPHPKPQVAPFKVHKIEEPSRTVTITMGELAKLYNTMYKMRRMEVASDMQYKAKLIRGFCHL